MQKHLFAIIVALSFICCANVLSQGESALPFLLISPSAASNGMGETSVALLTDNPTAMMTNPAHLGMQSLSTQISGGYSFAHWLPQFQQNDLWYRAYSINTGMNISQFFGFKPQICVGIAYSNIYVNLGEFSNTGSDPASLNTFKAHESSDQYTVALGFDYFIKISAGITRKNIYSQLGPLGVQGQTASGVASIDAYDYGFLASVPVVEGVNSLLHNPLQFSSRLSPVVDVSFGYAKNNMGDRSVVYIDAAQADPLPRYARVGIGFDIGLTYQGDNATWKPISFRWTIEANDLLVKRYPQIVDSVYDPNTGENVPHLVSDGYWEYQSGIGDINFMDEVIKGKTNTNTIKKKGWELNIYETFSLRGGRFEEDPNRGNRRFDTFGYGLSLRGLGKLLMNANPEIASSKVLSFIVNHIDICYNHSELNADAGNSPLAGTTFNSGSIALRY